jgi:hypothetical protein
VYHDTSLQYVRVVGVAFVIEWMGDGWPSARENSASDPADPADPADPQQVCKRCRWESTLHQAKSAVSSLAVTPPRDRTSSRKRMPDKRRRQPEVLIELASDASDSSNRASRRTPRPPLSSWGVSADAANANANAGSPTPAGLDQT